MNNQTNIITDFLTPSTIQLAKDMANFEAKSVKGYFSRRKKLSRKNLSFRRKPNLKKPKTRPSNRSVNSIGHKPYKKDSDFDHSFITESSIEINSEEKNSEDDLRNYMRINDFQTFKDEFIKIQKDIHTQIVDLKGDHDVFTTENMKLLTRLEYIDDTLQNNADLLYKKTKKSFSETINEYEAALAKEIVKWRRTNADLQQNQEQINHWMAQFSETNVCISQEIGR